MRLKTLFRDVPGAVIKGPKDLEVTGLCSNSKLVAPGNLFVAKRGEKFDGNRFVQEAIDAGAVAILTDMFNPFLGKIAQVIHADPGLLEPQLAELFFHAPSQELFVAGVTGTAGKTTVSHLIRHLFEGLGRPCGLIGSVGYIVGENRYPASHTTPDVLTCQRLLREMVVHECRAVAMEVCSHAMEQRRVDRILFDAAVFTNLTPEHLDYHGSMEAYGASKAKLFRQVSEQKDSKKPVAILNADCPWSKVMAENCTVPILYYGFGVADVHASQIELTPQRATFDVHYRDESERFSWGLIGKFNVSNCLAALTLCVSLGIPLKELKEGVASFVAPEGRLERVVNRLGLNIFVDFAHKPESLRQVLISLRQFKGSGRVITIFGCGGNRDRDKRPLMAKFSEELSDFSIVTNDNPRDEAPEEICAEILTGFERRDSHCVELDRTKAIAMAIRMAAPNDIILIAGKGHETYQIFGQKIFHFDDRVVAASLCAAN